jgi:hypothetical protein
MMMSQMVDFIPGRRLKSMMSDFYHPMAAFMPLIMLIVAPSFILSDILIKNVEQSFWITTAAAIIPIGGIYFLILNKDYFRGRSIAKRKYGYQIIDVRNDQIATPMQCMIRNISGFLWPIEIPFILFSPNRRLGDRIAGTKLVDIDTIDPKTIFDDINVYEKSPDDSKVVWSSILIVLLLMSVSLFLVFID